MMKEVRDKQYPEERDIVQFKNMSLADVLYLLREDENYGDEYDEENDHTIKHYLFDEFLESLRDKGIPVSPPERLHFMKIVQIKAKEKKNITLGNFFDLLRMYAQVTLIKDKMYYNVFHEAFDEYFMGVKHVFDREIETYKKLQQQKIQKTIINKAQKDMHQILTKQVQNNISSAHSTITNQQNKPFAEKNKNEVQEVDKKIETNPQEIKESLGVKEINENIQVEDENHEDNETQHGGKDQHNDILQKIDTSKQGGGEEKECGKQGDNHHNKDQEGLSGQKQNNHQLHQENKGFDGGGNINQKSQQLHQENKDFDGGGNLKFTKSIDKQEKTWVSPPTQEQIIFMKKEAKKMDGRNKYTKRPDKISMKQVVRSLRKIIIATSEMKSNTLDTKRSTQNLAKKRYIFEYSHEREKNQELVLLIDVGGPVDTWRPIIDEVTKSMTKGLSKLEVYVFHNNVYGYVWAYDAKNSRSSNYAKPNSLLNIKDIIKHRKRVIIYGDAEMAYSEINQDGYPPVGNEVKIDQYGMSGIDCLDFIKKASKSVVWLNPILKKQWGYSNNSGSLSTIEEKIPMFDLTVGGIEDAVKFLMKKK